MKRSVGMKILCTLTRPFTPLQYNFAVMRNGQIIDGKDCLILNVSKSTFDLFLRQLAKAWETNDALRLYDLHARYLR